MKSASGNQLLYVCTLQRKSVKGPGDISAVGSQPLIKLDRVIEIVAAKLVIRLRLSL